MLCHFLVLGSQMIWFTMGGWHNVLSADFRTWPCSLYWWECSLMEIVSPEMVWGMLQIHTSVFVCHVVSLIECVEPNTRDLEMTRGLEHLCWQGSVLNRMQILATPFHLRLLQFCRWVIRKSFLLCSTIIGMCKTQDDDICNGAFVCRNFFEHT